jgi:hypothetical protein
MARNSAISDELKVISFTRLHGGQAGGGHHRLGGNLLLREDVQSAGLHIGGGDEDRPRVAAQAFEIDEAFDQVLERIDVERIDVVWRQIARPGGQPVERRRALARQEREQPVHHRALQRRQVAAEARRFPEIGEPLARFVRSAAPEPVGQHHGVDRAGRGAGNALDREPAVFEQMLEHAPGEGAVRAPALQREIDALLSVRLLRLGRSGPAEGAREEVHYCATQPPSIE